MPPEALALADRTHMRIFAEVQAQQLHERLGELEHENEQLRATLRWCNSKLAWCRRLMVACGFGEFVYILDAGHNSCAQTPSI